MIYNFLVLSEESGSRESTFTKDQLSKNMDGKMNLSNVSSRSQFEN